VRLELSCALTGCSCAPPPCSSPVPLSRASLVCFFPVPLCSSLGSRSVSTVAALCRRQQLCIDISISRTLSTAGALCQRRQHCVGGSSSTVSTAAALCRQLQRCVDSCSTVSTAALCRQQHQQHYVDNSTVSTATPLCRQQQHFVDSNITVSTAAALYRQQHHQHYVDSSTVSTSVCVDINSTVSTATSLCRQHQDHGLLPSYLLPVRAIADTSSEGGLEALANCPVRPIGLACDGGEKHRKICSARFSVLALLQPSAAYLATQDCTEGLT
jgi:hypothetical protein